MTRRRSARRRSRLLVFNNNGRVDHWNVALDAWRADRWHGNGAGTFQNLWNRDRPFGFQVLDAHSLYFETMGELGTVGLVVLVIALLAIVGGLVARLRGPDRIGAAAVLAAADGMARARGRGLGLGAHRRLRVAVRPRRDSAGAGSRAPAGAAMPRLLRLVVALLVLFLALSPFNLWRSQTQLQRAAVAFEKGDCPTTIDRALDSLSAVSVRAEPWELIAYCDVRLGQPKLAVGAAEAAVRRDPNNWEYHYALALVRGADRQDPRPRPRRRCG